MFSFTLHLKNLLYIIKYFQITPDKRCPRNELLKLRKNSEQETNYYTTSYLNQILQKWPQGYEVSNEIIPYQKFDTCLKIFRNLKKHLMEICDRL